MAALLRRNGDGQMGELHLGPRGCWSPGVFCVGLRIDGQSTAEVVVCRGGN